MAKRSLKIWGYEEKIESPLALPIIKRIVANQPLSIQVHPLKSECWYIEEATENAFLYLGIKPEVNYISLIKDMQAGNNISSYLNKVYVKVGEFFVVPKGTIHAIGAGIKVIETQNMEDATYRIYDYGRDRGLDTNKALYCSNFCYHNPHNDNYF